MKDSTEVSDGKNNDAEHDHRFLNTLLVVLLSLIPIIIFLWVAILALYVYARFPQVASAILGVLSSSILLLLLRAIVGYVEKLEKKHPSNPIIKGVNNVREKVLKLWKDAFHPAVSVAATDIIVVVFSILLLFHLFYSVLFDPYTGRGRLDLNDSLQETSSMFRWEINQRCYSAKNGLNKEQYGCQECSLGSDGLQVQNSFLDTFHYCIADAADRYTNFIYQVQMTIATGDCGALLFRAYPARDTTYYYRFCRDGSFILERYDTGPTSGSFSAAKCSLIKGVQTSNCVLFRGRASDIILKKRPVYPITLAVEADGMSIDLFADGQHLGGYDDLPDQAYLQGFIGVAAVAIHSLTIVRFTNAMVWQL